ncbi:MAG: hypothetical protein DWQ31_05400 [Planctomycetota bacterium]|nr:MAG: hypothetical protein DWQ31_05400 [Planctomycetota bacterium]
MFRPPPEGLRPTRQLRGSRPAQLRRSRRTQRRRARRALSRRQLLATPELLEDRALLAADTSLSPDLDDLVGGTGHSKLAPLAEYTGPFDSGPFDSGTGDTSELAALFADDASGDNAGGEVSGLAEPAPSTASNSTASNSTEAMAPPGSLVYRARDSGEVAVAGEIDTFTIDVAAGQTISVVVDPAAALAPSVELLAPGGGSLGSSSSAAGLDAVLQTLSSGVGGTFEVRVMGTAATTGSYDLEIVLNAAVESEEHDGAANDLLATAQDLDPAIASLGVGTAARGAVVGSGSDGVGIAPPPVATPTEADLFYNPVTGELFVDSVEAPGATFTGYVLRTEQTPGFRSENHVPFLAGVGTTAEDEISEANFFDSAGLFNLGAVMPTDLDQAGFEDFLVESIYTGQLGTGVGNFELIVLNVPQTVDVYRFSLSVGELASLALAREGGGEIELELLDAAGNVLVEGADAANLDEVINDFVAPATGTYFARVTSNVVEYGLVVTVDGVFDAEANDTPATAQRLGTGGVALGALDASDDHYRFAVAAGDVLNVTTAIAAAGPGEFANTLDAAVELYDESGAQVAASATGNLSHTAGSSGTYVVRVLAEAGTQGEYVLGVSGNSGATATFEVVASDPADGSLQVAPLAELTIDLSHTVRLDTVDAGDLLVDGVAATSVTVVDADTLRFTLPALVDGVVDVTLAAGSLRNLQDEPLAAFASQFTLDTTGPRVISSSLQEGDTVAAGTLVYTAQFDRELSGAALDAADVQLIGAQSGLHTPSAFNYDPLTSTLTVAFDPLPDDAFTLTLSSGDGAFEDLAGADLDGEPLAFPIPANVSGDGLVGGDFVVNFVVDQTSLPLAVPLAQIAPAGGQVYEGQATGAIAAVGDTDAFTIDLDDGQVISVVLRGDAGFSGALELQDDGNATLATATAAAPGDDVVLQAIATTGAGTYTVTVSGDGGSTGAYQLWFVLGAAVEVESHGGGGNDTLAAAQDLDGGFTSLGLVDTERVAVLGTSDATANFVATLGEVDTVFIPNDLEFEFAGVPVPAGDGVLTVTATADLGREDEVLVVTAEGLLLQRLFMNTGLEGQLATDRIEISQDDLQLLAADGLITIRVDPNSLVNDLASEEVSVQLEYPALPATPDLYRFSLDAGEVASLTLEALTAGSATLELLDAAGNLLAIGAVGANADQLIDGFVAPVAGTYYARVAGNPVDYQLIVARGADFDREGNNAVGAAAQDITASGTAFGALQPGDVEPNRSFGLIQDSAPWLTTTNEDLLAELGHSVTLIDSDDLATTDLSPFDVVLLAGDQSTKTYTNVADNLATIEAYVAAGGVWVVNNAASDLELPYGFDLLPGADGVTFETALSGDLQVVDPTSSLIEGPGGTITDLSLDGGLFSIHAQTSSPLPAGASAILSTTDPGQIVAFDYALGGGEVIVHTLPIEFYGDGPTTLGRIFLRNLFDYAAELASEYADHYRVEVLAGDALNITTFLPAAGSGEFVNELDIAVELYDPSGTLVASSTTGSLAHVVASTGAYTVRLLPEASSQGEYAVRIDGQSGPLPAFEVVASDPVDGGRVGFDTVAITLDFSDDLLLTSVDVGDLVVDGSVLPVSVTVVDHDTLSFQLPTLADGPHTVELAAGVLTDLQGQPLVGYTGTFIIDTISPKVIASSILEGGNESARTLTYTVQFDEEITTTFLNSFDTALVGVSSGTHVPISFVYEPVTSTLTMEYANLPEDQYSLTLVSGNFSFEDLVGNDLDGEADPLTTVPSGNDETGGDFVFNFVNEYGTVPFAPLAHAAIPAGSLIYDSNVRAGIETSGDVDTYTLDVDPGQTLTLVVEAVGTLEASVALTAPGGGLVGTATAAPGEDAVVQTVVTVAGTYTIAVSGANGSTGGYDVTAILNAAVEDEAHGGTNNDTIATAQSLTPSFVDLGVGTADRGAVMGVGEGGADVYSFLLDAGQSVTLALAARDLGGMTLELLNGTGSVLAAGTALAANQFDAAISNFIATTAGTYFARVVGSTTDYRLIVTRDADFDTESNNDLAGAQSLDGETTVLGYLTGTPAPAPAGLPTTSLPIESLPTAADAQSGEADAEEAKAPAAGHDDLPPSDLTGVEASPNRLIVRFAEDDSIDRASVVAALGGTLVEELPLINGAVIELAPAFASGLTFDEGTIATDGSTLPTLESLFAAAANWQADPAIAYAEPDYLLTTQDIDVPPPNDTNIGALWGLHNQGQTGGVADADIDALEAWQNYTGTTQVVVASIDTGVDYTHEDLAANIWRNLAELNGTPGVDDDGNGFVDDIYGIDTANDDSDPMDDDGHGTHTSGTMGAVGNNDLGVTGVAWDVQIMALKFLNSVGSGTISDAIAAIDYMTMMKTDFGVNIVASNNSWSGGSFSQALSDAIEASIDAGILFVAAAANLTADNDESPEYPSSFDLDGIISVAATTDSDDLASFSNFGKTTVDLAAPGQFIWSTVPGDSYEYISGTSMATPHVTGAVAMLMAANPDASLAEVTAAILDGVDLLPALDGKVVSGGRLNLANSLALLDDEGDFFQIDVSAGDALVITTATPGDGAFDFENRLDPFVEIYDPSGTLVGSDDNSAADGRNAELVLTAATSGTYTVRVASSAGAGAYVLDVAVAPRVLEVTVNDKPELGLSSIEAAARGIEQVEVSFDAVVEFTPGDVVVQSVSYVGNVETINDTLVPVSVDGSGTATLTLNFAIGTVTDTWIKVTLLADGILSSKGVALDGDATGGDGYLASGTDLPSGDGVAGGNGVFLVGSLMGDTNGDGSVQIGSDVLPAFANFTGDVGAAGGRTVADGDLDEDGDVDTSDLVAMFTTVGNVLSNLPTLLAPSTLTAPLRDDLPPTLPGAGKTIGEFIVLGGAAAADAAFDEDATSLGDEIPEADSSVTASSSNDDVDELELGEVATDVDAVDATLESW